MKKVILFFILTIALYGFSDFFSVPKDQFFEYEVAKGDIEFTPNQESFLAYTNTKKIIIYVNYGFEYDSDYEYFRKEVEDFANKYRFTYNVKREFYDALNKSQYEEDDNAPKPNRVIAVLNKKPTKEEVRAQRMKERPKYSYHDYCESDGRIDTLFSALYKAQKENGDTDIIELEIKDPRFPKDQWYPSKYDEIGHLRIHIGQWCWYNDYSVKYVIPVNDGKISITLEKLDIEY